MCPSFLLSYIHCHCCCYYPKIFVGRKTFTFPSRSVRTTFWVACIHFHCHCHRQYCCPLKNPGRETLACPSPLPTFKAKAGLPLPPVQWRSFIWFLFLYLGICILIAIGKLYRGHGNIFWYLRVFLVSKKRGENYHCCNLQFRRWSTLQLDRVKLLYTLLAEMSSSGKCPRRTFLCEIPRILSHFHIQYFKACI